MKAITKEQRAKARSLNRSVFSLSIDFSTKTEPISGWKYEVCGPLEEQLETEVLEALARWQGRVNEKREAAEKSAAAE